MSTHIKTFLDDEYTNFAVYRVFQRLPNVVDCLAQTQRKILYTLESFPQSKKHKTAEVYSHVYTQTQYLHGDMSVYNVTENMARGCGNNINLLTEEGNFGSRTSRGAAAPRYTSTRFSKAARQIFPSDDKVLYHTQEFEGIEIEPKFLLPILPILLLNGYSGIAVGFASKFLPRDPLELINTLITSLEFKKELSQSKNKSWEDFKIPNVFPAFPFFNGSIIPNIAHESGNAWFLTGSMKRMKRKNYIHVTEVPPEYTREIYLKKLKKLQEKDIISNFTENCHKNNFDVIIKVSPEVWIKSDDEIMEILHLVSKFVENFTFLNTEMPHKETIIKYNSIGEYLKDFLNIRQVYYEERRQYNIDKITQEIVRLQSKIRFITEVNNENIIILKRTKKELENELKSKNYPKIEHSYDHLLKLGIHTFTVEGIRKMEFEITQKNKELAYFNNITSEDIHIDELQKLKDVISEELIKKGLK